MDYNKAKTYLFSGSDGDWDHLSDELGEIESIEVSYKYGYFTTEDDISFIREEFSKYLTVIKN